MEYKAKADSQAWGAFFLRLKAVKSFDDAWQLVNSTPPPGSGGREYYSNLGFFLQNNIPPNGASRVELEEYLRLIGCFDEQGILKTGARQSIEAALTQALKQRRW